MRWSSSRIAAAVCASAILATLAPMARADVLPESTQGYIVVTSGDAATQAVVDTAVDAGAEVTQTYGAVLEGFAADMTPSAAQALVSEPGVISVQPDLPVHITNDVSTSTCATVVPTGTQGCVGWNLDRVDTRANVSDGLYTPVGSGSGVVVYIVDTGVSTGTASPTHEDFTGRIGAVQKNILTGSGTPTDDNGHGTHVAGIAAGTTYGVAKQATIVGVKVLNSSGSGSTADVIAGLNWIRLNHSTNYPGTRAVVNMSLGGTTNVALDTATQDLVAAGIPAVVAAGNDNQNASNDSPARVATAITVGAIDSTDSRAYYSNYGALVDLFAPGSAIVSDWYTSTTATATESGTSMAAPHVAGAAAVYLAINPAATPAQVQTALVADASSNYLTAGTLGAGSPNKLLYLRSFSTRGSQVVTWSPSNTSATMPASSITPDATPTSTGDGTFTYSVLPSSTATCSVDASGTVSYTAGGNCYVMSTASQTASYDSAFKVSTFAVSRLSQTVTWAPTNTSADVAVSPLTPSALATTSGDGAITYAVTSAGTTGCAVGSTSAVLTFTTAGTCTVTATAAQTATYASATAPVSFTITGVSNNSSGPPSGGGSSSGGGGGGGSSSSSASSSSASGSLQAITELRPATGPLSGGNTVAIIGFGFTGATSVTIGGKAAAYTVVNDAHVEATVPAGSQLGSADVAVVLTPARGRAFAPGGYVYTADPVAAPVTAVPALLPAKPVDGTVSIQQSPAIAVTQRPATSVSPTGVVTVRTAVPAGLAGERVTLTRKGKAVASATVSPSGAVAFRSKRIVTGRYRMTVAGQPSSGSTAVAIRVPA